ncbi:MAG: thioredoxin domain-containing protein [Leptospira sp.]|nr:thioredoxin domain-containing protein [Leptospira sp.]
MKDKVSAFGIGGILLSITGVIISLLLIFEFFGSGGALVSTLCSVSGGGCEKVAESNFSGFRNLPLLGDLPVALFGFTFYGLVAALFITPLFSSQDNPSKIVLASLALALSIIAILADLALAVISVFVIDAVCILCVATYAVSIGIAVVSFLELKRLTGDTDSMIANFKGVFTSREILNKKLLNLSIIILGFFATGMVFGNAAKPGSSFSISENSDMKTKIKEGLRIYETLPVVQIDMTNVPIAGEKTAPITIVKYADFNCGHCMHASHILKTILAEYTGIVRVAYKNFPLDGNCNKFVQRQSPGASSCIAASAAICAEKQGRFYPVYAGMYSDNEKGQMHTVSSINQIASLSGLNMSQFKKCLGSTEVRDQIMKEVDEAGRLRIESTPSIFVNNRPIASGTPEIEFLRALINHLMKKS